MPSTAKTAPSRRLPRLARACAVAVTRVATWVAVLCLLYAGYQLWVTDLLAAWSQQQLRAALPTAPASSVTATELSAMGPRDPGAIATIVSDPVAQGTLVLQIPRITLDLVVLGGVGRDQLRQGPGLLPGTPAPGLPGNSVIAAHRTTWGAPFGRLDELRPGDRILAGPAGDPVAYTVLPPDGNAATDGHRIVTPSDVSVTLQEAGADRLTLVTCHPRFSAARRLVVVAQRTDPETTPPPAVSPMWNVPDLSQLDFGGGNSVDWPELIPPAATALLIWAVTGTLSGSPHPRPRWRQVVRWITWRTAGAIVAAIPLLVTFTHLAHLWPTG